MTLQQVAVKDAGRELFGSDVGPFSWTGMTTADFQEFGKRPSLKEKSKMWHWTWNTELRITGQKKNWSHNISCGVYYFGKLSSRLVEYVHCRPTAKRQCFNWSQVISKLELGSESDVSVYLRLESTTGTVAHRRETDTPTEVLLIIDPDVQQSNVIEDILNPRPSTASSSGRWTGY